MLITDLPAGPNNRRSCRRRILSVGPSEAMLATSWIDHLDVATVDHVCQLA
jgi:hypothetical protein